MPGNTIRRSILTISIGLFILSLTQKCFVANGWEDNRGVFLLFSGAMGILGGESAAWCCWLANPALLIAWVMFYKYPKASLAASFISLLLCLMFLSVDQIMTDESGNNFSLITDYQIGYWLWLSSSATMFLGNIIMYIRINRNRVSV